MATRSSTSARPQPTRSGSIHARRRARGSVWSCKAERLTPRVMWPAPRRPPEMQQGSFGHAVGREDGAAVEAMSGEGLGESFEVSALDRLGAVERDFPDERSMSCIWSAR